MEEKAHDISILITESAKGDAESSKKLYEYLVDKIYAYVGYRTSTKEHAIDITQDVFIDFFGNLHSFEYKSPAHLYAYVFVITKRKLARHYADMNMRGNVGQTPFDESVPTTATLDTEVTYANDFDTNQALSLLDDVTREIVALHHFSQYTFGEIAVLLQMNESAVRVRHHRALKVLAQKMGT